MSPKLTNTFTFGEPGSPEVNTGKSNNSSLHDAALLSQFSSIFYSRKIFSQVQTIYKIHHHSQRTMSRGELREKPAQTPPNSVTPSGLSCPAGCFSCHNLPGDTAALCCQTQQTQTGSSQQNPAAEEHKISGPQTGISWIQTAAVWMCVPSALTSLWIISKIYRPLNQ